MMSNSQSASVVLIESSNRDESHFGTGFVIRRDGQKTYFLTCAHVVRDVGGPDKIKIQGCQAKVIASSPEGGADLAVLCLAGLPGSGALENDGGSKSDDHSQESHCRLSDVSPLPLRAAGKKGERFTIAGFQSESKRFLIRELSGTLGRRVGVQVSGSTDRISAWDLEITDTYSLQPGYSGSPVIDRHGNVIGVVNTRRGEGKTGVAVSIETLEQVWPEIPLNPVLDEGIVRRFIEILRSSWSRIRSKLVLALQRPPDPRRRFLICAGVAALGATGVGLSKLLPPPPPTVTVRFTFSTEKMPWIKAAYSAFQEKNPTTRSGRVIQVQLDPRGSEDALDQILRGSLKPTVWSPASSLEITQLKASWESQNKSIPIIETSGDLQPKSLVVSPLVFAAWAERAERLKRKFGGIDFQTVHDAVTLKRGWADIDDQHADWGKVKFGHTRPDRSNSGLLTTILIAYAFYHNQSQVLTIDQVRNPDFKFYFYQIENGVKSFGNSSGTFFPCFLSRGPSTYDLITTYENLVLTSGSTKTWELFYPPLTIFSDHPFAILTDGVSEEEREAAIAFRTFLLQEDQQRLALLYGFRPNKNSQVLLTDPIPGNLFNKWAAAIQIQPKIGPTPDMQTVNALIQDWKEGGYDEFIAAPGC